MSIDDLLLWLPGLLAIFLGLVPCLIAIIHHVGLQRALRRALDGTLESQRQALRLVPDLAKNVILVGLCGWVTLLLGLGYLMTLGIMSRLPP